MNTLSHRMDFRLRIYGVQTRALGRAFWAREDMADRYPNYLFHLHDSIRASADLLETAADLCDATPQDPVCARLGPYFRLHAAEEHGHDQWVLQDLEALGVPREQTLARIPSAWAASLVGAYHYWVRYAHPVALMGYLIGLEWTSPRLAFIEGIGARGGVPMEAFTCALNHARLDPGHRAEMEQVLDDLSLDPGQEALLGLSLLHACQSLAALFQRLVSEPPFPPRSPARAGDSFSTSLMEAP